MSRFAIYAPDIYEYDAVGNHCIGLANMFRDAGWEVELYAQRWASSEFKISPVSDIHNKLNSNDILVVSYSIFDSYIDEVLAEDCRKYCYFHGVTPPELLEAYEPVTAKLCRLGNLQLSKLGGFLRVISNSQQSAEVLRSVGLKNATSVIPPVFLNRGMFKYSASAEIGRSPVKSLISVGRVVPHKKIEDTISVFAQVAAEYSEKIQLRIVGSTPNHEYLKYLLKHIRNLGILESVTFYGLLHDVDLYDCYRAADVFISTSAHEGFGVPLLEAMYFGVPAFVRSGTAMDEFIFPEDASFQDLNSLSSRVLESISNGEIQQSTHQAFRAHAKQVLATTSYVEWLGALDLRKH